VSRGLERLVRRCHCGQEEERRRGGDSRGDLEVFQEFEGPGVDASQVLLRHDCLSLGEVSSKLSHAIIFDTGFR
jgi:hypothetical protein